ncbi:chloramphenicol-sensitive protein RarD [Mycobacterium frederiksbergense]|uniref:Chloramphenicol-sensitive protein RarD n=1 Tax=Mycolicibacterium frederiksbergense TaxID=117567 RepID=A0ABT6KSX1_9MYCO|nr:EamA family transporter RarD [Mycolicibacterium frederiksbergense]MDH6193837.1 chloramphenicol-sensitive protein RarD [Mycolicibacterium frederiksbergense]
MGRPAVPSNQRIGLLFGLGAYGTWGLFPAFFPLLKPAGAGEILAHRIVWTAVFMLGVLIVTRRLGDLRTMTARTWLLLACASVLISTNWVIYIYAVNNGHVVDAALGYFMTPLVSVLLGVLFFRERLNAAQAAAVGIALLAVLILGFQVGAPPFIGLGLALSFGVYGAVKKVVTCDPRVSVGVEAAVAAPFALAFIAVAELSGGGTFTGNAPWHIVLMLLCGPLTAIPLLLFGGAAHRLPMVTLGLLLYLTPAMQMTWGVLVGHEPMPLGRWIGFALIWVALLIMTVGALRRKSASVEAVDQAEPESSSR